jgi:hypothetical protein
MDTTLLFLIIRVITLILSGVLAFRQVSIIYKKRNVGDKMKPYRLLLFLFTLAFFTDNAIVSYMDTAKFFFDIGHGVTADSLVVVRLMSRVIEITAIGYFYKLIYSAKNNK